MSGEKCSYLISECCCSGLGIIDSGENGNYFICRKCNKPTDPILIEEKLI